MPRPASLGIAVSPTAIHETALPEGAASVSWYGLTDAKAALNIVLADTSDDARLMLCIQDAVGYLEASTGRRLSPTPMVAEYEQPANTERRTLRVPVLDATVNRVTTISDDGTETDYPETDYEIVYKNREPHIRLGTEVDAMEGGIGINARVFFTVEMAARSSFVSVMRIMLNELVGWHFDGKEGQDPRETVTFRRNINLLQDLGGTRQRIH